MFAIGVIISLIALGDAHPALRPSVEHAMTEVSRLLTANKAYAAARADVTDHAPVGDSSSLRAWTPA